MFFAMLCFPFLAFKNPYIFCQIYDKKQKKKTIIGFLSLNNIVIFNVNSKIHEATKKRVMGIESRTH